MTPLHPPLAYTTTRQSPAAGAAQPSMADVFASFDPTTGLVAQVQGRIAVPDAPLVPAVVADAPVEQRAHARPYAEPRAWSLLKHGVQGALVISVVLFVLHGGSAPLMALSYVATALVLVGTVVVADRMRFQDHDPLSFEVLEVVGPDARAAEDLPAPIVEAVQIVAAPPVDPLVPLVEQMEVVMPSRVDVT